jgi:hypothetical protein
MELLLILLGVFILANLVSIANPTNVSAQANENKTEKCPPHKWRHEEIKDPDGEIVSWKLVCDKCGPLKADSLSGREDGIY